MPRSVSLRDAARLLGTTESTVRRRIKRGEVKGVLGDDGRYIVEIPDDVLTASAMEVSG